MVKSNIPRTNRLLNGENKFIIPKADTFLARPLGHEEYVQTSGIITVGFGQISSPYMFCYMIIRNFKW